MAALQIIYSKTGKQGKKKHCIKTLCRAKTCGEDFQVAGFVFGPRMATEHLAALDIPTAPDIPQKDLLQAVS